MRSHNLFMRRCHASEERRGLEPDRRTQAWHYPFISSQQCLQYMLLLARSGLCSMLARSSRSPSDWEPNWDYQGSTLQENQHLKVKLQTGICLLSSSATSFMLVVWDGGIPWSDRQTAWLFHSAQPRRVYSSLYTRLDLHYSLLPSPTAQNHCTVSSQADGSTVIDKSTIIFHFWNKSKSLWLLQLIYTIIDTFCGALS